MMRFTVALMASTLLAGCSGTIWTTDESGSRGKEGIPYYQPKFVVEAHRFELYAKDGKKPTRKCTKTVQLDIKVMPDLSSVRYIKYEPGLLETNTFGATLDNGIITSVNAQSTPAGSALITSISGALKDAGLIGVAAVAPKTEDLALDDTPEKIDPECNAGKVFIGLFESPKVNSTECLEELLKDPDYDVAECN